MDKYVAKLNDYFIEYKKELKAKFIAFNVERKKGLITGSEFQNAASKIHYFNNIISNIMIFLRDDCKDVLGYIYELSTNLEDPSFSNKDVYNIIKYVITKNYNNFLDTPDEMLALERVQNYNFKSMSKTEVNILVESGRLNSLVNGDVLPFSLKEKEFLDEFFANFSKFMVSMKEMKKKTKTAYDLLDNFDTIDNINKFKGALKDLDVTDGCINRILDYLNILLEIRISKEEKNNKPINPVTKTVYKTKAPSEPLLTEKDVRTLKKDIRSIFDLYHRRVVKYPNFEELIHTLKCLDKLGDVDSMTISLFICNVLDYYMNNKLYIVDNYDDMIFLASLMYRYKTEDKKIYEFIRYTSENIKVSYDNFLSEYEEKHEKIKYYDEDALVILDELLDELISGDVETKNFVALSIMDELDKVNNVRGYKYELNEAKNASRVVMK